MPRTSKLPAISAIVALLRAGESCQDIATRYGVSTALVYLRLSENGIRARDYAGFRRAATRTAGPAVNSVQREAALASMPVSPPWMEDAACLTVTPDLFFPAPRDRTGTREARAVCRPCPVRSECLRHALATDERYGIWGGLTVNQRTRLQRTETAS